MNEIYPRGELHDLLSTMSKSLESMLRLDPEDTESRRVDHSRIRESLSVWWKFHDHNTDFTP